MQQTENHRKLTGWFPNGMHNHYISNCGVFTAICHERVSGAIKKLGSKKPMAAELGNNCNCHRLPGKNIPLYNII